MDNEPRYAQINISAIPVAGIGGIGMLAGAVIMAWALPEARWLLFAGGAAGALLGAILILMRSRTSRQRSPRPPAVLFVEEPGSRPATRDECVRRPTEQRVGVVH